jgi:hypothetical protein
MGHPKQFFPNSGVPGFSYRLLLTVVLLVTIAILAPHYTYAQDSTKLVNDTATRLKVHSPKKAALYSSFLPGLGQAYNHKYWKIPIIYAGFAATGYFISSNGKLYRDFRDAYAFKSTASTGDPPNEYAIRYSTDQLLTAREYYRRNLEVSWIVTGVWYILNIVDATVDAHFFDYDISDDLSLQIKPHSPLMQSHPGLHPGFSVCLKF